MSIESTLFAALDGDATLTALLESRIFPQVAPDNAAVPYITYQLIATEAHNVLNGAPGSERKLLQVNCISKSYSQAKDMAAACKGAIEVSIGYLNGGGDDYFNQTQNHRVRQDFALIG